MQLYLVRHPKPLVASGVCYGASDVKCSAEALGTAAADLLAELPKACKIISSPLSRCEHFAQLLCVLEPSFAYKTDSKITEMNFGAWEMQAWDSISVSELQAWTDDFAHYRCGQSGESTGMFMRRVAERLIESLQGGEDQVWITHAGVIRAVQWLSRQSLRDVERFTGERFTGERFIAQPDRAGLLGRLRAADWAKGELAFGRVQTLDWSPDWQLGSQVALGALPLA
jgi:alpha-ribazole phosphatase